MRLLVCGGRDFDDEQLVFSVLDKIHVCNLVNLLIHGGAEGADNLAERWAKANRVFTRVYTADWKNLGKAAGPIRNTEMLEQGKPDLVVVFPGGAGTQDMVRKAKSAGVRLLRVAPSMFPPTRKLAP